MTPLAVVKDLGIFLDRRLRMSARFVILMMCQFVFHAAPKTFHRCIIVTISLPRHGSLHAELFDQFAIIVGAVFTSNAFTGVLKREGIAISMDGRGRALDNIFVERLWRSVKYEDVYLQGYGTMGKLIIGLARYFAFYNGERPHQSLGNRTPHEVYASGQGGGAKIVDKFGGAQDQGSAVLLQVKSWMQLKFRQTLS
jgi:hypothetical protein